MALKKHFFILLFFASLGLTAQDEIPVILKWSSLDKSRHTVQSFLSDAAPPFVLNVRKGSGFFRKDYLFELNADMSIGRRLRIQPTHQNIPLEYADAFSVNNKNYVFSYFNNRSHNATYLFATSLKPDVFKMSSDMRKVGQAPFINQRVSSNFTVQTSLKDSFVLVYSQLPPSKGSRETVRFSILNQDLRTLKQEENKLAVDIEAYGIESTLIDDSGNAYFVAVEERSRNLLIRNDKEAKRHIYTDNPTVNTVLDLPDGNIVDYALDEQDGVLRVLGFYSNSDKESFDGVFAITYDNGLSQKPTIQVNPLPQGLSTQFEKSNQDSKNKRDRNADVNDDLLNFELVNLVVEPSGAAFLIAEYREFYSTAIFDGAGNEHFVDHFNHEKILVAALSPEGNLMWVNQIPKYQYTTDDGGLYSSFVAVSQDERLIFLYNDSERNYRSDGSVMPYSEFSPFRRTDRSVFTMVTMEKSTGDFKLKPLFSTGDAGVLIKPSVHLKLEPSSLLLYGDRGRKSRFLKITWQK